MSLADRIRNRIEELGLTQGEVAVRASISQGMVYKLVSGKSKSTSKIVELARALECDLEWLATGADPISPGVREETTIYDTGQKVSKFQVQKLIQSLPVKDQKDIALKIMKDLMTENDPEPG